MKPRRARFRSSGKAGRTQGLDLDLRGNPGTVDQAVGVAESFSIKARLLSLKAAPLGQAGLLRKSWRQRELSFSGADTAEQLRPLKCGRRHSGP